MEELERWLSKPSTIVRHLPSALQQDFSLSRKRVRVTIKCDLKSGGKAIVRHKYAVFTGDKLRHMRHRDGEECEFEFDEEAAHVGRLYSCQDNTEKGTEIDVVNACGEWAEPHRLRDRKLYRKLRRKGAIPPATSEKSPVWLLAEYLANAAAKSKDDALRYADLLSAVPAKADVAPSAQSLESDDAAPPPQPIEPDDDDEPITSHKLSLSGDW